MYEGRTNLVDNPLLGHHQEAALTNDDGRRMSGGTVQIFLRPDYLTTGDDQRVGVFDLVTINAN